MVLFHLSWVMSVGRGLGSGGRKGRKRGPSRGMPAALAAVTRRLVRIDGVFLLLFLGAWVGLVVVGLAGLGERWEEEEELLRKERTSSLKRLLSLRQAIFAFTAR